MALTSKAVWFLLALLAVACILLLSPNDHSKEKHTDAGWLFSKPLDEAKCYENGQRKLFLSYMFDAESSTELDKAQWLAIGRWLTEEKADSSGETAFREYAVAEFENVVRQTLLEQGQADMFSAPVEAQEHALPAEA